MGYVEYGQFRIYMQGRTEKRTTFEVKIQRRDKNNTIGKRAITKRKSVESDRFILEMLIHN
ncbi:hypothetical protein PAT3040_02505 [Paenibacillus agaridevorans]|uniref:Uncharacterized protein n=1 Tax=Paenibacillus agaridevorans TaxID=171404 RepID=A0A2R5EMP8_9BACL|nr:hypothetical protein PAT3040_02505 [Paenibacillus agaridevorans]